MENLTPKQMTALLGVNEGTLAERAQRSTQLFVRSQDALAFYSPEATGQVLTASQVCRFPIEKLAQILEYGSAVLPDTKQEPAHTFQEQREYLNLTIDDVARVTGLSKASILAAESENKRSNIHDLVKIARALSLDELKLTAVPGAGADLALAVRLRAKDKRLSAQAVLDLSEASWVIRQQLALHPAKGLERFEPSPNYGHPDYPAWMHGQYLARKTREILALGNRPIRSMRKLIEEMGIPVVQLAMPKRIAGATIAVHQARGIVANLDGDNRKATVRRFTLAHELGHLLWDPAEQLRSLRVDSYEAINELSALIENCDNVESRANAFAIELLAPALEVVKIYRAHSVEDAVNEIRKKFGISFTAAQHHLRNCVRNITGETLSFEPPSGVSDPAPYDDWSAAEDPAYFPIKEVRDSRRGDFARRVIEAEMAGQIHATLAASWLGTTLVTYQSKKAAILELA